MSIPKSPIVASLVFFIIAAFLGLSMRTAFVIEMPEWFNYKNVQHAHSHVALLGWLFAIFYLSIIGLFKLNYDRYKYLFWALQSAVLGMLLTFPIIGYASFSIFFSTAHIILSYVFAIKVWRDLRSNSNYPLASLFLKASLIFMVLSTFGTWAIGIIMGMGLKGSAIYYGAIQFYLHFQFNGWFIFALLALLMVIFKQHSIQLDFKKGIQLFWILIASAILTFALAISWSTPYLGVFLINSAGVLFQLFALLLFFRLFYGKLDEIKKALSTPVFNILSIAMIALFLKILIQSVVVFPAMAEVSYTIRNFVLGFIHLLLLGSLSLFALGIISYMYRSALSRMGIWFFVSGIVATEFFLFGQGLFLWLGWGFMPHYYLLIAIASALILLGLIMLTIVFINPKNKLRSIL